MTDADLEARARAYAERMGDRWDAMGHDAREAARRAVAFELGAEFFAPSARSPAPSAGVGAEVERLRDDIRRIEANFDKMRLSGHLLLTEGRKDALTEYWFRDPPEHPAAPSVSPAYDRELIAEMLEAYMGAHDGEPAAFLGASIEGQIRLLREADNAEAANIGTVSVSPAVAGDGTCNCTDGRCGTPPAPAAEQPQGEWLPMDSAPRDGTMVRLLVQFDDHATEDSEGPAPTIGANNDDNVGPGEGAGWQFAGWCWTHDHFTEGKGTPVGWLPMLSAAPSRPVVDEDSNGR